MLTSSIGNDQPTHRAQKPKDTQPLDARKNLGDAETPVRRPKHKHEALASTDDLWQRPMYRLGDGDHTSQVLRSGSMRAYALPSRGFRT